MTTNKALSQTYSEKNLSELPKLPDKRKIQALTILKSFVGYSFSLYLVLGIVGLSVAIQSCADSDAGGDYPDGAQESEADAGGDYPDGAQASEADPPAKQKQPSGQKQPSE